MDKREIVEAFLMRVANQKFWPWQKAKKEEFVRQNIDRVCGWFK